MIYGYVNVTYYLLLITNDLKLHHLIPFLWVRNLGADWLSGSVLGSHEVTDKMLAEAAAVKARWRLEDLPHSLSHAHSGWLLLLKA